MTVDQALLCSIEEDTGIWENKLQVFANNMHIFCVQFEVYVSRRFYIVYLMWMCGSVMKLLDRSSRQNIIWTK